MGQKIRMGQTIRTQLQKREEVGPLTPEEVTVERDWWIRHVQDKERNLMNHILRNWNLN